MSSASKTRIDKLLTNSILAWYGLVFLGQLIFALYIIGLYGSGLILGDLERWNEGAPHAYTAGDNIGTITFGVHVFIAAIISMLGPLQLIPKVRTKAPKFHRISGRIYIVFAFIISFAGLYLSWIKGSVGGVIGSIFVSINALFIMICAYQTIKFGIKRRISKHKKWAVGLFLSMSGVWFYRVCIMFWILINGGKIVGFDSDTFMGPAIITLDMICYVLPLMFYALLLNAIKSDKHIHKYFGLIFMILLCLVTIIGLIGATMGMWFPSVF